MTYFDFIYHFKAKIYLTQKTCKNFEVAKTFTKFSILKIATTQNMIKIDVLSHKIIFAMILNF